MLALRCKHCPAVHLTRPFPPPPFPLHLELRALPPVVERVTGSQTLRGDAFDDWLGGPWWRTVSKPASHFSAILAPNTEVTISLSMESVIYDSHHECDRCTRGIALCLDNTRDREALTKTFQVDPNLLLAFVPRGTLGPEPSQSCEAVAGSCGPLLKLTFQAEREIKQTRRLYRLHLANAMLNEMLAEKAK